MGTQIGKQDHSSQLPTSFLPCDLPSDSPPSLLSCERPASPVHACPLELSQPISLAKDPDVIDRCETGRGDDASIVNNHGDAGDIQRLACDKTGSRISSCEEPCESPEDMFPATGNAQQEAALDHTDQLGALASDSFPQREVATIPNHTCNLCKSDQTAPGLEVTPEAESSCDEIAHLRTRVAAAEKRAVQAEQRLAMWESLASRLSYIMALGPDRGEQYRRTFMKELSDAINSVTVVQEVRDLVCSIPTVQSEAPNLSLVSWSGDLADPLEWDVHWSTACWSFSLTVIGRQFGLSFSLKLHVHHFGLKGRIKVVLPEGRALDLSQARVSFIEFPNVDFTVDSEVALGVVPLPVQSQVAAKVRSAFTQWLSKEIVEPNAMLFTIPSLKPKYELSDRDVQQAILDAEMIRRQNSSYSWILSP